MDSRPWQNVSGKPWYSPRIEEMVYLDVCLKCSGLGSLRKGRLRPTNDEQQQLLVETEVKLGRRSCQQSCLSFRKRKMASKADRGKGGMWPVSVPLCVGPVKLDVTRVVKLWLELLLLGLFASSSGGVTNQKWLHAAVLAYVRCGHQFQENHRKELRWG